MEKIYPSLSYLFAGYLDEVEPSQRNMDASAIQRMNNDRERSAQRILELEGSLGLTLQSMQRVEMRIQACKASVKKEEPKKAPIILMEDNLIKAKRAIMITKTLCPTGEVVQAMMSKPDPSLHDAERIAKMKEMIIRKTREYINTFPKYNGGQGKDKNGVRRSVFMHSSRTWRQ